MAFGNLEVLVIFDDVSDVRQIEPFLPNYPRFKVIITTRTTLQGGIFNTLVLKGLKKDKTLDLLESLAGSAKIEADRETARSICAMLGHLPLAIELVGGYLERRSQTSLATLRERLEQQGLNQEALQKNKKTTITAKRGVKAAIALSWEILSKEAQGLAMLLSLFALAPIPWEWVQQCYPGTDPEKLEDWREEELIGQSLLKFEGDGYELHPLVREFFAEKRETWEENEERIEQFCRVVAAQIKVLSDSPTSSQVRDFVRFFPHIEIAAEQYQDSFIDDNLVPLLTAIASYYNARRLYGKAESWFKRCLSVVRIRFGEEHLYVATALDNLANFYRDRGRYEEAEPLCLQALELRKKLLGEEHPDVATSLDNLATLYYYQGRYEEAESLCLQALELRKKLLGEEHHDVGVSLNSLANLYRSRGRYEEAEPLLLQALELRKKLLGEEHPDFATSLNNLGSLYLKQGRYNAAEPLYLQALDILSTSVEENHPLIQMARNNLRKIHSRKWL